MYFELCTSWLPDLEFLPRLKICSVNKFWSGHRLEFFSALKNILRRSHPRRKHACFWQLSAVLRAARLGFEPRYSDSESEVLPLDDLAIA